MNRVVGLMGAAGVGAGVMYVFDPDRGRRRRAEIRNKAKHFNRIATDAAGKTGRDVRNHLRGMYAEMESLIRCAEVSNEVLQARIRSKLGRIVSHPHAIEVKVVDGVVTISGAILTGEVFPLLNTVECMAGVKNIDNRLEIHEAADIPALRGGKQRLGEGFGVSKMWSPTARLIAGTAGGALTIYGGKRRGVLGCFIGTVGLGVLATALKNPARKRSVAVKTDVKASDTTKPVTADTTKPVTADTAKPVTRKRQFGIAGEPEEPIYV